MRLALHWLVGGQNIKDIFDLDVSDDVIAPMLLQAANNAHADRRKRKEQAAYDEGYKAAMDDFSNIIEDFA